MQGSLARPFAAILLMGVCGAGALLLLVAASPGTDASTEATFGVYFEPESVPEEQRLNVAAPAFEGLRFPVVRNVDDLSAALEPTTPDSIWIHQAALDDAPADLLRRLKRRSVVMVGIETTESELARLLAPVPSSGGDWRHPTEAMFAMYWEQTRNAATPGSGQSSSSSWSWTVMSFDLADPAPLVSLVLQAIEERDRGAEKDV